MTTEVTEAREYKSLTFTQLCLALEEPADTIIICHSHPDGDAIGSSFALRKILEMTGSRAYCVCEDEVPKRLKFFASPIQSSSLCSALPDGFVPQRIISVDTPSLSQMGTLAEIFGDKTDIMIDHHRVGNRYADGFIDPKAAATGEIVYKIADTLIMGKGRTLPLDVCTCLYAAISSDTGCFKYSNVTPTTHMVAASLIKSGIDAPEINRLLFDSKSPARLHAEKVGLENLRIYADGRITVVGLDFSGIAKYRLDPEELDAFIDVARCVEGTEISFSVRQTAPGDKYRVSMRSAGNADVSKICAAFDGGGHVRAAGCTVTAPDLEAAISMILSEIQKQS